MNEAQFGLVVLSVNALILFLIYYMQDIPEQHSSAGARHVGPELQDDKIKVNQEDYTDASAQINVVM